MIANGNERTGRKRRRWRIATVAGTVFALLAVRFWLYEEPIARFDPQLPDNVTFQYWAKIETEDGWKWVEAPAVPVETGQAILKLLDGSERFVVEGEWVIRLNHWPPVYKPFLLISPPPPNATLKVLSAGTDISVLGIDFIGRDNSNFLSDGWFVLPEENLPALSALLDELDAQCESAYRRQQDEDDSPGISANESAIE